MFKHAGEDGYKTVLEKVRIKTLAYGENTLMAEFRLEAGANLPLHNHPHEQTGYLVSGKMELTIGNDTFPVNPGDSWSIAGGVEHQAAASKESVAIEVFYPVREDYLPGVKISGDIDWEQIS